MYGTLTQQSVVFRFITVNCVRVCACVSLLVFVCTGVLIDIKCSRCQCVYVRRTYIYIYIYIYICLYSEEIS